MDILFEFLLELLLEGSVEAATSPRLPKWVRYPLIFLVFAFIFGVCALLVVAGVAAMRESTFIGVFLIVLGIALFFGAGYGLWKKYRQKRALSEEN